MKSAPHVWNKNGLVLYRDENTFLIWNGDRNTVHTLTGDQIRKRNLVLGDVVYFTDHLKRKIAHARTVPVPTGKLPTYNQTLDDKTETSHKEIIPEITRSCPNRGVVIGYDEEIPGNCHVFVQAGKHVLTVPENELHEIDFRAHEATYKYGNDNQMFRSTATGGVNNDIRMSKAEKIRHWISLGSDGRRLEARKQITELDGRAASWAAAICEVRLQTELPMSFDVCTTSQVYV